ncbi:MAG: 1-deoxy-D-xylulose-5-phosphate reductoisomerase [Lachnospiraceae bacterium]|nr:1-deoxy-D-xylulose-5-phosphate reductoisomerase [Lachnospiraceae bacterium]
MREVTILGSTGSIGTQTLEVLRNNNDIKVAALTANRSVALMEAQIREFRPALAVMMDEKSASDLKVRVADLGVRVESGMDGVLEACSLDSIDTVVSAIVGMIGIRPAIASIKAGKDLCLANKETLVCAGHLIMPLASDYKVKIIPVDSEHSAIFQSIKGLNAGEIVKIILTASGGPFRGKKAEELLNVTVEDTLKHPNWEMGAKVTVDSATLANKGLEVMEAHWLFGKDYEDIEVVIHPQSIIHSMVECIDKAVLAQLGTPDMRLPIQYALYYPDRKFLSGKSLNFSEIKELTFEKPDTSTFFALDLAYKAGKAGGSLPTIFNAANEAAVAKFLNREITFMEISEIIEACMERHKLMKDPTVVQIEECECEIADRMREWK